jgi:hypothetical protein
MSSSILSSGSRIVLVGAFLLASLMACRSTSGTGSETSDVSGPGNPRIYAVRGTLMSSLIEVTIDSATPQKFCFGVDTKYGSLRTFLFSIGDSETCRYSTFQVDSSNALELIHGAFGMRENLQVADVFVAGRVVGQISKRHSDDELKLEHLCTGPWADVCDLDLSTNVPALSITRRH